MIIIITAIFCVSLYLAFILIKRIIYIIEQNKKRLIDEQLYFCINNYFNNLKREHIENEEKQVLNECFKANEKYILIKMDLYSDIENKEIYIILSDKALNYSFDLKNKSLALLRVINDIDNIIKEKCTRSTFGGFFGFKA